MKVKSEKQKRITFIAAKIRKNSPVFKFYDEKGKEVYFKNKKDIPKSIALSFSANK